MVQDTERSNFYMIKERRDDKFSDAVNAAISKGWKLVNATRPGHGEEHVAYFVKK